MKAGDVRLESMFEKAGVYLLLKELRRAPQRAWRVLVLHDDKWGAGRLLDVTEDYLAAATEALEP